MFALKRVARVARVVQSQPKRFGSDGPIVEHPYNIKGYVKNNDPTKAITVGVGLRFKPFLTTYLFALGSAYAIYYFGFGSEEALDPNSRAGVYTDMEDHEDENGNPIEGNEEAIQELVDAKMYEQAFVQQHLSALKDMLPRELMVKFITNAEEAKPEIDTQLVQFYKKHFNSSKSELLSTISNKPEDDQLIDEHFAKAVASVKANPKFAKFADF